MSDAGYLNCFKAIVCGIDATAHYQVYGGGGYIWLPDCKYISRADADLAQLLPQVSEESWLRPCIEDYVSSLQALTRPSKIDTLSAVGHTTHIWHKAFAKYLVDQNNGQELIVAKWDIEHALEQFAAERKIDLPELLDHIPESGGAEFYSVRIGLLCARITLNILKGEP